MPHKINAGRRDKIPKQKHRVTNWAEYNESLRRRCDLTVWISDDALALWAALPRTTPGGQPVYSDLAIELWLTLGMVFKQPLRQTQGLMRSIAELLGVEVAVPDFSTLARKRRSWRKLHLGLDLVSGQIVCSDLTTEDIGDPTALPGLLDQIDGPVDLFLADGAYDGEPTCAVLTERFGSAICVTIPPAKNAVLSPEAAQNPSIRDRHIADTRARGRMAWQKASGYNQRSRGETLMGRWKTVIGPKLKARSFENQKTEAGIGVRTLNWITELGLPNFERTA